MRRLNLLWQNFGRLKVTNEAGSSLSGQYMWLCECSCGNTLTVRGGDLVNGTTKSCGCLRKEVATLHNTSHGHTGSPTYHVWEAMLSRCRNPSNPNYFDYGGRNIFVCERWYKFENFLEDMGEKPEGLSIERTDNNSGYSLDNCVWASMTTQARNRRSTRNLTYRGETLCVAAWADKLELKRDVLYTRLRRGWSVERTLGTSTASGVEQHQEHT